MFVLPLSFQTSFGRHIIIYPIPPIHPPSSSLHKFNCPLFSGFSSVLCYRLWHSIQVSFFPGFWIFLENSVKPTVYKTSLIPGGHCRHHHSLFSFSISSPFPSSYFPLFINPSPANSSFFFFLFSLFGKKSMSSILLSPGLIKNQFQGNSYDIEWVDGRAGGGLWLDFSHPPNSIVFVSLKCIPQSLNYYLRAVRQYQLLGCGHMTRMSSLCLSPCLDLCLPFHSTYFMHSFLWSINSHPSSTRSIRHSTSPSIKQRLKHVRQGFERITHSHTHIYI